LAKKTTSSVLNKAGRKKPVQPSQAAKTPPSSTGRTGPKPTLTKDQIACAAIAIADSDGLEGISMQRVARAVGVTTMALYRYFSSKTELIELMIEIAGGPEPNLDAIAPGWSSSLAEWAHQCSAIYRRRPWFLQATMTPGRKMGPNELGWLNAAFLVLGRTRLEAREQHQAFLALIGHVRSSAEFAAAWKQRKPGSLELATLLLQCLERYPALASAIESGAFAESTDDDLDFGLECILSGIKTMTRGRKQAGKLTPAPIRRRSLTTES